MVATPTSEIACKARTGASWSSGVCTLASAASNPSAAVDPCVGLSEKDAQSKGCTFKKISTGEDPDAYDISGPTGQSAATAAGKLCGKGMRATLVSVPLGCRGTNNPGEEFNPIIDVLFAIVRFLSAGVGIALIVGLTIAGIQYTVSRGDPNNTAKAIERIRSVFIALFVYIFAYAFLNFIIPGGLLS